MNAPTKIGRPPKDYVKPFKSYQIFRAPVKVCRCRKDWKVFGSVQDVDNINDFLMGLRGNMPGYLFKAVIKVEK